MRNFISIVLILLVASCSQLDYDNVNLVDSLRTNNICFHENTSSIDSLTRTRIIKKIKAAIDTTSNYIDVVNTEIRVMVNPELCVPGIGMGGQSMEGSILYLYIDPLHENFSEAINTHISKTISHEYHHNARCKSVGDNNNLIESLILEGLACHFTMEVCKSDTPFYCQALTEEQLIEWEAKAKTAWFNKEYDHFEWFIGIGRETPDFTGYTIGFNLVSDYLKKHPNETAASLYAESTEKFYE